MQFSSSARWSYLDGLILLFVKECRNVKTRKKKIFLDEQKFGAAEALTRH